MICYRLPRFVIALRFSMTAKLSNVVRHRKSLARHSTHTRKNWSRRSLAYLFLPLKTAGSGIFLRARSRSNRFWKRSKRSPCGTASLTGRVVLTPADGLKIPSSLRKWRVQNSYSFRRSASAKLKQNTKIGARGGSRTHMRKNPRRILSPQRLPFRHPGSGTSNLTNRVPHRNNTAGRVGCAKTRATFRLGATALFHQAGSVADGSLQAIRRC